ncbi:MAG TPA: hypothetical protein VF601_20680 [Beijerinckiaceae bacterium]|jgi:hypothetical protein
MRALTIVFGLVLLLPGLCGIWGGLVALATIYEALTRDSGQAGFAWLFAIPSAVGLGLGWFGVWLLRSAFHKRDRPPEVPP